MRGYSLILYLLRPFLHFFHGTTAGVKMLEWLGIEHVYNKAAKLEAPAFDDLLV